MSATTDTRKDHDRPLLEMRGIAKRFPGVLALDGVDLAVDRGEIVALIGENGAGKSTLMKILGGIYAPDSGTILIDGLPRAVSSVEEATRAGVALIHQELNLADNLTVAENVFLGHEPLCGGWLRIFDRRRAERDAAALASRVGLDCPMGAVVSTLSPGVRQLVEVMKALSLDARILVMDEPTSSLSRRETELLFAVIRSLKDRGVSVVYISHRLGEVREVADRAVVLRDGRNSGELSREEATHDAMVRLMVGRQLTQYYRSGLAGPRGEDVAALEARGVVVPGSPGRRIDLVARRGEVLGVAGLVGAGRTELARTLFGIDKPLSGTILVGGKPVDLRSPLDAIRARIGLVPEDRRLQGLVIEMTVGENITLAKLRHLTRYGFIRAGEEASRAREMVERLGVRTRGLSQEAQLLSGGNQQKVVLAKWLLLEPKVLILDEPTRGVDVGAKHEIYRLIDELTAGGVAIVMISSDMEEVLGMSDRVVVMHEGALAGELSRDELSEENVMMLATGKELARIC